MGPGAPGFAHARGLGCRGCHPSVPAGGWLRPAREDINGDGVINVLDLIDLLLGFGTTCP